MVNVFDAIKGKLDTQQVNTFSLKVNKKVEWRKKQTTLTFVWTEKGLAAKASDTIRVFKNTDEIEAFFKDFYKVDLDLPVNTKLEAPKKTAPEKTNKPVDSAHEEIEEKIEAEQSEKKLEAEIKTQLHQLNAKMTEEKKYVSGRLDVYDNIFHALEAKVETLTSRLDEMMASAAEEKKKAHEANAAMTKVAAHPVQTTTTKAQLDFEKVFS